MRGACERERERKRAPGRETETKEEGACFPHSPLPLVLKCETAL